MTDFDPELDEPVGGNPGDPADDSADDENGEPVDAEEQDE